MRPFVDKLCDALGSILISPHGCCAAEWRHMAGYVSSYPTLWSVFDMLLLSRQKQSREEEEENHRKRRKWADPDHTTATFTVTSAHFVIYKAQEGEYFFEVHLG